MRVRAQRPARELLVGPCESRLFSYVLRSVDDRALAEELMRDVLARVRRDLPRFDGASGTSRLFAIATDRVIDELCTRVVPQPRAHAQDETAVAAETVDVSLAAPDPLERIWTAVAMLGLDLRMPLLLREIAGMSYVEIAETLGLSPPAVRSRIYLARQHLLEQLLDDAESEVGGVL